MHPNPRLSQRDGQEFAWHKPKHGGWVEVISSQTSSGFYSGLFPTPYSVCSKFQTSAKKPDQQPLETKVLVPPTNRNKECLRSVSSSKAPRHLMSQAWRSQQVPQRSPGPDPQGSHPRERAWLNLSQVAHHPSSLPFLPLPTPAGRCPRIPEALADTCAANKARAQEPQQSAIHF